MLAISFPEPAWQLRAGVRAAARGFWLSWRDPCHYQQCQQPNSGTHQRLPCRAARNCPGCYCRFCDGSGCGMWYRRVRQHRAIRIPSPPEYETAKVSIQEVTKSNDRMLSGLTILREGENFSPTVYLEPFTEQMAQGAPWKIPCERLQRPRPITKHMYR